MTALLELELSSHAIVTFSRPDSAITDSSMAEGQGPPLHDDSVETQIVVDESNISRLKRLIGRLPSRLKRLPERSPKDERVWGVYCVDLASPPTKATQEVLDSSRHGVSVNGP
jgi:hypothetical protein